MEGCELHAIRYAGDEQNNEENISRLNSVVEGGEFTQVAEFLMDFHTDADLKGSLNPDFDYTDYQWWLACTEDGDWKKVSKGY